VAFLKNICRAENIPAEVEALEIISQNSQGDVRSAINDLQALLEEEKILRSGDVQRIPVRNRGLDIFDTLRGMFSATSPREAMKTLNSSLVNYDTLMLAIHDNLPLRYRNPKNLAAAYDVLSKADVFRGRIGREKWRLLRYVLELLAQSTIVAPEEFRPFAFIYPPTKIWALSRTRRRRTILETLCERIGSKCHVSRRSANLEFIPFLKIILRGRSDISSQVAAWLGLDEKMIELLKENDWPKKVSM
jgi:replication factor C large subunit